MTFELHNYMNYLFFLLDPLKPHFYYISIGLMGSFSHGDIFMERKEDVVDKSLKIYDEIQNYHYITQVSGCSRSS